MSKPKIPIKKSNSYLKYSGLAFQLAFVVFAGIFIGKYLDSYLQFKKPIATMVLVFLFFGGYMYKLYIDLTKTQ